MISVASQELIDRLRAGDRDAVEAAFERHGRMVYNVCLRILHEPSDAEDATQATFMLLLAKARGLGRQTILASWLFRSAELIARRAVRSRTRRKQREERARDMAPSETSPEIDAASASIRSEIDRALATLPEKLRAPLVVTYLEGHTRQEAAQILQLKAGTVDSRLARALEALRKWFARRGQVLTVTLLTNWLSRHGTEAELPSSLHPTCVTAEGRNSTDSADPTRRHIRDEMKEEAMRAIFWARVKSGSAVLVALVFLGAGLTVALTSTSANSADTPGSTGPREDHQNQTRTGGAKRDAATATEEDLSGEKGASSELKVRPMAVWERDAKPDEEFPWNNEAVYADGMLYLCGVSGGGSRIAAIDGSTGGRAKTPRQNPWGQARTLPLPEGLVVCDNMTWMALTKNGTGRIKAGNKVTFHPTGRNQPVWSRPTRSTVYCMAREKNALVLADREGFIYGFDLTSGKPLWEAALGRAPGNGVREKARPVSVLARSGNAYVLVACERYRIMPKDKVPKGSPSSWSAGMPDNMRRVITEKIARVCCFVTNAPQAPARPEWTLERPDPDICPNPTLFWTRSGKLCLFTGQESLHVEPKTGRILEEKRRAKAFSYFKYLGSDRALKHERNNMYCLSLNDLVESWRQPDEPDRWTFKHCARVGTYAITLSVIERELRSSHGESRGNEEDQQEEVDAKLTVRSIRTGRILYNHEYKQQGKIKPYVLPLGDRFIHCDSKRIGAYRLKALGEEEDF